MRLRRAIPSENAPPIRPTAARIHHRRVGRESLRQGICCDGATGAARPRARDRKQEVSFFQGTISRAVQLLAGSRK